MMNEVHAQDEKHDKQVCAAVLIYLERTQQDYITVGIWYPDNDNRMTRDVDLLAEGTAGIIVLEHTLIQTYPDQVLDGVQFVDLFLPLEEELRDFLPDGDFTLSTGIGEVRGAKSASRIRALIKEWVKQQAPALAPNGPPGNWVTGGPDGVPFDLALMRHKGNVNRLKVIRSADMDALEQPLSECLDMALKGKLPKLAAAADRTGGHSVFVMESADHLKDCADLVTSLQRLTETAFEMPDSMFVVETHCREEWFVRPICRSKMGLSAGDPEIVQRNEVARFLKRLANQAE